MLLMDTLILVAFVADFYNGGKRICSSWSRPSQDWYYVYKVINQRWILVFVKNPPKSHKNIYKKLN